MVEAMSHPQLWSIEWGQGAEALEAIEPTLAEVRRASRRLAMYYNDDHNRTMMAHDHRMSPSEVVAHYQELRATMGHPFLLRQSGEMVGDADVRNIADGAAEIAILIGARGQQGRGLGTRFAVMIHAFAFRTLELARIYISLIPANVASRRLFEKLGYTLDDSPQARAFIDEASDLTMSLDRPSFESARHKDISEIKISPRRTSR